MKLLKRISILITSIIFIITCVFLLSTNKFSASDKRTYLSDLTPISKNIGYGTMKTNTNMSGGTISYYVDGVRTYFYHGITAHATSTVVYDIEANHKYNMFSTYLGVDASQGGAGDVKFTVWTSSDNKTWNEVLSPTRTTSSLDAIYLEIDITNVRYLKFNFDSNGPNGNDHSGLGNPLLYSSDSLHEADDLIKPVEYFDNLFEGFSNDELLLNHRLDVLRRALIESADYDTLKERFLTGDQEFERREMLEWLWNDEEALSDFICGGAPDGSYVNCLSILSDLYCRYSDDLLDTTELYSKEQGSNRNRGDLYRTMMLSIALTHADGVHMWIDNVVTSDPIVRYQTFKDLYLDETYHVRYDVYENLNVEEMRWVMQVKMHNDEVNWLNAYVTNTSSGNNLKYPNIYSPHRYLKYGKDWDYTGKGYKNYDNFSIYDEKYSLTEYGVPFSGYNHLWMVFEGSHICWGISYVGTNFAASFGVPSHYVSQSGHAAFFVYNKNAEGKTTWSIDNNISGWTATWIQESVVGYANNRNLCNWGNIGNGWSSHDNATYVVLSSTALDNYEQYRDAEILLTLNKFRQKTNDEEQLYKDVLDIQPYHLDAWEKLCKYYADNKTNEECGTLAEDLCKEMYYFPLPMHDLLSILKKETYNTSNPMNATQKAYINTLENIYLNKGLNANTDNSAKALLAQPDICRTEASFLLGKDTSTIATFSFDGDNANKLVFSSSYSGVRFTYSLDGGSTWSQTHYTTNDNLSYTLSQNEIDSITSDNDILIWLEGWQSENNNQPIASKAYRINIQEGSSISNPGYNNSENRFLGNITNVIYSIDNGNTWNNLTSDTLFDGDITVQLKKAPTGQYLAGPVSTYTFTQNNTTDRKYVTIDHLSIDSFSSEEQSKNDYASHVIDGLYDTRWHTRWSGGDSERYITIKVDHPIYLTGIDYYRSAGNGTVFSCNIYVSMDGINYTLAGSASGWANDDSKKQITFEPILAQYVKFQGVSTIGGYCNARLIELYEDITCDGLTPSGISIDSLPNRTTYFFGNPIDTTGLNVSLNYSNSKKVRIPNNLLTIMHDEFAEEKEYTVNVSYLDYSSKSFNVTVKDIANSVCIIGGVGYESLIDAVNACGSTDEIILMKDINLDSTIQINKTVKIIGNGHTISRTEASKNVQLFSLVSNGNLTLDNVIIDGGCVWSGEINTTIGHGTNNTGINSSKALITCEYNSKLYINNNTILQNNYNNNSQAGTSCNNCGGAIYANGTSYIEINKSSILNCYQQTFGAAIYHRDNSTLVINDGTISGCYGNPNSRTTIICSDNTSSITFNGGKIINNSAGNEGICWVSKGTVNVNGGTIFDNNAENGRSLYIQNTNNVYINSFDKMDEIYIAGSNYVTINNNLEDKYLSIKSSNNNDSVKIAVLGSDVDSNKVLHALEVNGKLLSVNDNNEVSTKSLDNAAVLVTRFNKTLNEYKTTYFESLEDAVSSSIDNDEITLLKNIDLTDELVINTDISINLGSYNLSGSLKGKDNSTQQIVDGVISFITIETEPTYTWNDTFTECVATRCNSKGVCETEYGIIEVILIQQLDCTHNEIIKYKASFTNSAFETQYSEEITTEIGQHSLTHVDYKKQTMFESGVMIHEHCVICGANFVDGIQMDNVTIKSDILIFILLMFGVTFTISGIVAITIIKKKNSN